ncbi:hypothetical protein N9Y07_00035 [Alphaproteobacteria bacterium]|nr:hypothetical protein [Alphaproteobacteria bacterium]
MNDEILEDVFAKQVNAPEKVNDALIGIMTIGASRNVSNALSTAEELGIYYIFSECLRNNDYAKDADIIVNAGSKFTSLIQH